MVGRTDEKEYLERRTDQLLSETLIGQRIWERKAKNRMTTNYNVVVPEDGENYWLVNSLIKVGPKSNPRYVLVSHETGFAAGPCKLRSVEYKPLGRLGDLVFSLQLILAGARR